MSRQIMEIKRKQQERSIAPEILSQKKLKDLLELYEYGPQGESIEKYFKSMGDENIPVEEVIKDVS